MDRASADREVERDDAATPGTPPAATEPAVASDDAARETGDPSDSAELQHSGDAAPPTADGGQPAPASGSPKNGPPPAVAPAGPGLTPGHRVATTASRALQTVVAGIVGALPILWVLGAVPWRIPTVLIENMFRGFTACAMDGGSLNPVRMVCNNAGVPIGMHQLDGGLSYPLGGVFLRMGAEPLAAWKLAVAVMIVIGVAALFWVVRAITASPWMAAVFTGLYGLSATLTARSWNWYWNLTSVALLPVLFASIYLLYRAAAQRRLLPLALPAVAVWLSTFAIAIEWQYAGLFATILMAGSAGLLTLFPRWRLVERAVIAVTAAVLLGSIYAGLSYRLAVAGIGEQFRSVLMTAAHSSIDLAAFVAPDARASFVGVILRQLGRPDLLAPNNVEGPQLWVAPYLGIATIVLLVGAIVVRRGRWTRNPDLPGGYALLLVLTIVGSIALSIGPIIWVARHVAPETWMTSPLQRLWIDTPMKWIRYPWTWGYLTHTALLIGYATLAAALFRRPVAAPDAAVTDNPPADDAATDSAATQDAAGNSAADDAGATTDTGPVEHAAGGTRRTPAWSPLALLLVAALALDFVSPATLLAVDSPEPSTVVAPFWVRIDSDDPAVAEFQRDALPELRAALVEFDGPVTLLPWTNGWTIPILGPDAGVRLRNTGIDRNVALSEEAAPLTRYKLRNPTPETVSTMLQSGWSQAVVLLDQMPTTGSSIVRLGRLHPGNADRKWFRTTDTITRELVGNGYCAERGSWFTVLTLCPAVTSASSS